ncbi:MAG: N(4)-(beta-N-acetylglucosaminyl)-L-asparaginase [Bacteroidota bacterium]
MSTSRRSFLKRSSWAAILPSGILPLVQSCSATGSPQEQIEPRKPVVISTWNHGIDANAAAWEVLKSGGSALDAVEQGVRVTEADPSVQTVGLGGFPDSEGNVTLDACIMNEAGDCGSVAYLQGIKHPISVARKVMEETPHVMLVGQGARKFAESQGFEVENLLTPASEAAWKKWQEKSGKIQKQEINVENHDTIGMVALDQEGNLSGACTTSGASWKMPGRVGDSPIIGAGLYVDNAVGGAAATGWGEAVIRIVGCHLVVEFMRQGHSPEEACRLAVDRVIEKNPDYKEIQVGFIALNKQGEVGAFCIQSGFDYAVYAPTVSNELIPASSYL